MEHKALKVLNLTEGFDPVNLTGQPSASYIKFETLTFSGGEPHIKLDVSTVRSPLPIKVIITHRINSFNDFGLLLTAIDALRGIGIEDISLFIPYFPAARQDRRMVEGEPLTVKIYTEILNSLSLSGVTILDPHSDVTPALLNRCHVINNHEFVRQALQKHKDEMINIVVPDAGANKKALKLVDFLTYCGFNIHLVKCDKERDVKTGKLTGFSVNSDVGKHNPSFIVDDICDGGGTFVGLAGKLREKGYDNLNLIVTHGIFSKGTEIITQQFRRVCTTDSIQTAYANDRVEVYKIRNLT